MSSFSSDKLKARILVSVVSHFILQQQRNIKKKFISLLKKFKVASDESDGEHFPEDQDNELLDEDFLYDDLDEMNLSDSGTEGNLDEISIGSTPKPVLRLVCKNCCFLTHICSFPIGRL